MNFVNNFIPEEITKAIGWTLFHSIWQGIVVAVLLGTFLLLTDKKNAKLRYNISVVALFLLFILAVSTFVKYYELPKTSSNLVALSTSDVETLTQPSTNFTPVFEKPTISLPEFLQEYFGNHLPLIVSIWLMGFLFFSFRFVGGLFYVQRLRTTGLTEIDSAWSKRLKDFSYKIKINRAVQIFGSTRVKVPVAIGHLKPIILLPLGLLSGLPGEQVEAILIHELAHIKRYDFLVNLFQSFIETLFFYHPVVWWISSTINSERENCCDDIALQMCGNPLSYSKALYNLQQIRTNETGLALAIIGKKNNLYRRIKRMNSINNKTAYGIRFAAFAALLIVMALVSVFSNSSTKNESGNIIAAGFVNPFASGSEKSIVEMPSNDSFLSPDTTSFKKGQRTLKFHDDADGQDKRYKAKLNNGKLEELYIDGDKVDDKDLQRYQSKIAQKLDEYDGLMKEYRQSMRSFRDSMRTYREKMRHLGFKHNFNFDFDFPPIPDVPLPVVAFDSSLQKEIWDNVHKELAENLANLKVNIPPIPPIHIPKIPKICIPPIDLGELRIQLDSCKFDTAAFHESMKELKEHMKDFKFDMKKFNEEMKKNGPGSEAFKKSMEELKKNMHNLKEELKPLKGFMRETRDELVKDNLIQPGEDIDGFKLTKDEMIVDGKKVSPELHKKYLEIYHKHYGKDLTDDHKIEFDN